MSKQKTIKTAVNPATFIGSVSNETRRKDALELLDLFAEITGLEAAMWGPSIIGFGRYHYRYASGREGESMMTGFSPRKANLVIYIMPGYRDYSEQLDKLGKHKIGKSCLHINKLADININILREIIADGFQYMQANYETQNS
ncbi:hypothetical protein AB833_08425 [Chromatiales bacterium (ex Bugula neritina AB1)]|nr:hypothetical protein AB833_08425 [Chromatiales bacterium (ex Bugula neritina AB1)]